MFKYVFVMSVAMGIHGNSAIAQVGLQISARYNLKIETPQDEFPPDLFLTFLGPAHLKFNINPEIHYDLDLHKRNWPGVGAYTIKEESFGGGFCMNYKLYQKEKIYVFAKSGFGFQFSSNTLHTTSGFIREFVIVPKVDSKWYGYASIGSAYKVAKNTLISMDFSVGLNHISFGYAYLFKKNEK